MSDVKSEQLKVVVIDDQLNIRKALYRIFDKAGNYLVEDFANAKEAIAWLRTHSVDLIITDIYMPLGNGFDVLSHVRSRSMQNDIPVLFISGEATKEDIVKSVDLGVTDYIIKPFGVQDILNKVSEIINKYKNPPEKLKKLREAEMFFFSEKYSEAKIEFEKIIEMDNKPTARTLIGLAQTESKLGNVEKAMSLVNKAIASNSMYYPAYSVGADLLIASNKKFEAVEYLIKELSINSKQINRRVILADIYLSNPSVQGHQEKALEQMKLALQESPTDESLLLRFAEIMWSMGNKEKAVHYCMKARRQNPNSMKALLRLGELYVQEGEPLKAVHIYSDILNKTPYQYDVYLCRARIFEKIGEYSKSFDDLNKIPKTMIVLKAEVLKAKGRVLARMNKVTEAIAVCEEVASMEPTTDNLARVGLLFIRMKDYRNALGWYEQATLMNETHPKYIYNLGCCYEALRQNEKAIDCYEKSLKLDPNAKETVIALSRMKSLGTSRGLNISEKNISSAKSTSKVN